MLICLSAGPPSQKVYFDPWKVAGAVKSQRREEIDQGAGGGAGGRQKIYRSAKAAYRLVVDLG